MVKRSQLKVDAVICGLSWHTPLLTMGILLTMGNVHAGGQTVIKSYNWSTAEIYIYIYLLTATQYHFMNWQLYYM